MRVTHARNEIGLLSPFVLIAFADCLGKLVIVQKIDTIMSFFEKHVTLISVPSPLSLFFGDSAMASNLLIVSAS